VITRLAMIPPIRGRPQACILPKVALLQTVGGERAGAPTV
jgi:hypothetical protein